MHPAAAGTAVQIIDVLRDHGEPGEEGFHSGEGLVTRIRPDVSYDRPPVRIPFPDKGRIPHKGFHARQLFRLEFAPDPIGTPERGDTALRRNAGAGERHYLVGLQQAIQEIAGERGRAHGTRRRRCPCSGRTPQWFTRFAPFSQSST